jgi:hypothetical protein
MRFYPKGLRAQGMKLTNDFNLVSRIRETVTIPVKRKGLPRTGHEVPEGE